MLLGVCSCAAALDTWSASSRSFKFTLRCVIFWDSDSCPLSVWRSAGLQVMPVPTSKASASPSTGFSCCRFFRSFNHCRNFGEIWTLSFLVSTTSTFSRGSKSTLAEGVAVSGSKNSCRTSCCTTGGSSVCTTKCDAVRTLCIRNADWILITAASRSAFNFSASACSSCSAS